MVTSFLVFVIIAPLMQNVVHGTNVSSVPDDNTTVGITSSTIKPFIFHMPAEPSVMAAIPPVSFGTAPHWDCDTQALYYVSLFGRTLMRFADGSHFQSKLDGMPTFIIPIEGKPNHFAVGLDRKVVEVEWLGGDGGAKVIRTIAEVDVEHPENSLSHGKADPRGRLFAGTVPANPDPTKTQGSLYRFDADGTAHKLLADIGLARGLCWDLSRQAFYFIDNLDYSIRRYDYDEETGDISNPKIVFAMQGHEYIVTVTEPHRTVTPASTDAAERYVAELIAGPRGAGRQGDRQEDDGDGPQRDYGQDEQMESHDVDEGGLLDYDQVGKAYAEDDDGYAQGGPQGDGPDGPPHTTPDGLQEYAAGGPQDFSPLDPQDSSPLDPQDSSPLDPQDSSPLDPQDPSPLEPQDYAQGLQGRRSTLLRKKLSGVLDGMTIDTDGNLWVANYNGSQVLQIDPKKSKLLQVVKVQAALVTSATFGGAERDTLYVTSAAAGAAGQAPHHSPAGATFAVSFTGAKGHPDYKVRFNHITESSNGTKEEESKVLK